MPPVFWVLLCCVVVVATACFWDWMVHRDDGDPDNDSD